MPKNTIKDTILSDNYFDLDDFNPAVLAQKIAIQLKKRRIELNLTQQALSEKAGISLGSLKRFESKFEISLKSLLMIAVVLDATEEFHHLFSKKYYQNIQEVVKSKQNKTRKRARMHV
jgi:transcriptional regulator with XRE-family HTH domain